MAYACKRIPTRIDSQTARLHLGSSNTTISPFKPTFSHDYPSYLSSTNRLHHPMSQSYSESPMDQPHFFGSRYPEYLEEYHLQSYPNHRETESPYIPRGSMAYQHHIFEREVVTGDDEMDWAPSRRRSEEEEFSYHFGPKPDWETEHLGLGYIQESFQYQIRPATYKSYPNHRISSPDLRGILKPSIKPRAQQTRTRSEVEQQRRDDDARRKYEGGLRVGTFLRQKAGGRRVRFEE